MPSQETEASEPNPLGKTLDSAGPRKAGEPTAPHAQVPAALPSRHKTHLGIAHPGIAPLQPNVPKPTEAATGTGGAASSTAHRGHEQTTAPPARVNRGPGEQARSRSLRVAAITIVSVAVLLTGAAVVLAIVMRAGGPIQANVVLDDQGNELLELECRGCKDGTVVSLGGGHSEFKRNSAVVPMGSNLQIGDNEVTVTLRHPDGRTEDVDLKVPVSYRLSTDLKGLAGNPPTVRVNVAATTGTTVVVDGKPVALDESGQGKMEVDVSRSLTGPASSITSLKRQIPYSVTRHRSKSGSGQITVRIGVTPLVVDAPGSSITIDSANFWLSGRAVRGGTVSVSGRPISTDPAGRFAQLMNVSSVGETTIFVRADAADQAPRLVPVRVRRVASLKAEAERVAPQAERSYSAVVGDSRPETNLQVMLQGTIREKLTEGHATIVILDVKGCKQATCLARARHGAKIAATSGDTATVYGQLAGTVDWNGTKIPNINAEFVLPESGS